MSRRTKLRIKPGTQIPDNWLRVHNRLTNSITSNINLCYWCLVPRSKNSVLSSFNISRSLIFYFLKSMMQSPHSLYRTSVITLHVWTWTPITIAYHRRKSARLATVDPLSRIVRWYILLTEAGQDKTLAAPLTRAKGIRQPSINCNTLCTVEEVRCKPVECLVSHTKF